MAVACATAFTRLAFQVAPSAMPEGKDVPVVAPLLSPR
jgi:hypothetical protein